MKRKVFGYPTILYLETLDTNFVKTVDLGILFVLFSVHIYKHGYISFSLILFDLLELQLTIGTRN